MYFRTRGLQKGRDGARVPLPWSGAQAPYGFGKGDPAATWLPQPSDWAGFSVAAQESDPHSTLAQYRDMLRLRHAHPGLQADSLDLPDSEPGLLVIQRGRGFACVVNFSDSLAVSPVAGRVLVASDPEVMVEGDRIILPPSTGAWIQY